ncbi:efflux RND transporter periplasmic adaptor subunit [Gottschalkiaceae bacterium SANA]|nr:efflux RND transporter periplasmic adaptor subunit [Gottschalkiaceae bacterium SANA]
MKRVLGIFLASVLILTGCQPPLEITEEPYVPVEVTDVQTMNLEQRAALSGVLMANREAMIMVPIAAAVERVDVRLGQWVEEDDPLFRLDAEAIEDQVEQAAAAFDQARAGYESNLEQLRLAQTTAERLKRLYEAGAVSKSEWEQAKLAASPEMIDALLAGFQQAKTMYDQTNSLLNDLEVKAPISGKVSYLGVTEQGYAAPGQPAAIISDASTMKVAVNLPSKLISLISVGDSVSLEIPAIQTQTIGEILAIGSAVDQQTFLYPVEVRLENQAGKLLPGMFAKVYLVTERRDGVVAIPIEAVIEKLGLKKVFVQEEDRAVERLVETGLDDGSFVEIVSGLSVGEKLIVKGQSFLEDQARILVVEE